MVFLCCLGAGGLGHQCRKSQKLPTVWRGEKPAVGFSIWVYQGNMQINHSQIYGHLHKIHKIWEEIDHF